MKPWSTRDIRSQRGRFAVITGATGDLGYETSLALAGTGARVVLTVRSPAKGAVALEYIRAAHPCADIRYEGLDLASLASVQGFAGGFRRKLCALDILADKGGDGAAHRAGQCRWVRVAVRGELPSPSFHTVRTQGQHARTT